MWKGHFSNRVLSGEFFEISCHEIFEFSLITLITIVYVEISEISVVERGLRR